MSRKLIKLFFPLTATHNPGKKIEYLLTLKTEKHEKVCLCQESSLMIDLIRENQMAVTLLY